MDSTAPDGAARLAAYNAQQEEFNELAARFAAGGYRVKDLLVDLMLSKEARASGISGTVSAQKAAALANIGSGTLLSAGRLNRKVVGVLGSPHAGFNNPFAGAALSYSEFDGGVARLKVATELHVQPGYVPATGLPCRTPADGWRLTSRRLWRTRLLFAGVTMADTPANKAGSDKIQATIVELFDKLWNQRVTSTDAEVQRMYNLLVAVYNDRNNMPATPLACQFERRQ